LALLGLSLVGGCEQSTARASRTLVTSEEAVKTAPEIAISSPGVEAPAPAVEPQMDAVALRFELAQAEIARVLGLPELPGAPLFDGLRAQLVARAKSEPVLFVRTPEFEPTKQRQFLVEREKLRAAKPAWRALEALRKKFERRPEALRSILLRDGYLYSESPDMAFALVSQVRPEELFRDAEIWIARGGTTLRAHYVKGRGYFYDDGPEAGARVKLLHLDRVGSGGLTPEPLHRDVRSLSYQLFFDGFRVRRLTERAILADLAYGNLWIPSVLESDGARLTLKAELVAPEAVEQLTAARTAARAKFEALNQLQGAMLAQIDEALPFDEPKTEFGQEDGKLRREWIRAYRSGATTYVYNDDSYRVFDRAGRPRVPQVCIDFILDTFERAAGSWWLPSSSPTRARTEGKFRFSSLVKSTDALRQTSTFVKLAEEHPEAFDVLHFEERSRIELGHKERLFKWLQRHAEDFDVGDVILIRGLTPWDEVEEHTHAFFVYEVDPLTRIPIAIAGNAGPANLWSWETEARRTPHRTIRARIRPKAEWLTQITQPSGGLLTPPPLIAGPR
jgi:hypothetical protein